MDQTPISLLERLRRPGERGAWDRFVEIYTPLLWSWAGRTGLQASDAADLIQDVFVTLLRTLPEFRYDSSRSFRSWLRTLAGNRWRDLCRRRAAAGRQGREPLPEELAGPDPGEEVWEEEYRKHLATRALRLMQAEFQPATWKACWRIVAEGRPPAEVARELGITLAAAYAAKARVLHRLREELAGMLE
jgi:RNA polymerase sigma-70 factor (ECF subfamily)